MRRTSDGRYVAFQSRSTNLAPDDTNGTGDVSIHDTQTGETSRVSVASNGAQGNEGSREPSISADGRFIAFDSCSTNLVPNDSNHACDVFVHDSATGRSSLISLGPLGQANLDSARASMSADGRFVAFQSAAGNLVPSDTNGAGDVFVRDRRRGRTDLASVASDGSHTNCLERCGSGSASISADGRFVAFDSYATNLVNGDTNDTPDVFLHDRLTGLTVRVSVDHEGSEGNGLSLAPGISPGGAAVGGTTRGPRTLSPTTRTARSTSSWRRNRP